MKRGGGNRPGSTAGFTLVELLLAITLMSILLALTYSGLRGAARSTESGEDRLAVAGEIRAGHQFIRKQLNQVLPLAFAEQDNVEQARIFFIGDSRNIWFVAPMPGYLGSGGPHVQNLELVSRDDGYVLQFRHALFQFFEPDRLYDRDPIVLLKGIESANFEFMGFDAEGFPTPWMPVWDQAEALPSAVRLNIGFSEQEFSRWPGLVAGVRIDEISIEKEVRPTVYEKKIQELISGRSTDDIE